MNIQSTALHRTTTTITSYTTPQSFSLFSIPSMSFSLLTYSLLSSPFASVCFYFFFSVPSLSLGSAWVSLLNPPYQHVWLMKKGNVCRNSIILTCWWQGGCWRKRNRERKKKKQCPSETPLTEVQLALLWTKDVIILFKIMSEKLAIKRFITSRVTIEREALFMIQLEQILLNI